MGGVFATPLISLAQSMRQVTLITGIMELVLLPTLLWLTDYPRELSGQEPKKVILGLKFWAMYTSFVLAVVPLP